MGNAGNPGNVSKSRQYALGAVTQIPEGEGRAFRVGDRQIAVFRGREGAVYATQAECPHRQGPLADGLVGGGTLVCPLHEWRFDLATGQALNGSCDLEVFPVTRGEDGGLLVELPGPGEPRPGAATSAKLVVFGGAVDSDPSLS